ncbi:hypothetical protein ANN_22809 [Periplaneta americana]|uniref:Uncharacterized protein n=1 Tax=Periplaneta americana TaxID=6978 RepID=A0ABQ8SJT0_PERAM|nr:hypothetical protein ANN_22809 [Periplaneta americana]
MAGLCEGGNEPSGSLKAICSSTKMDFQTGLVCVGVVVLSAVVIFVISMFGMKEKTYEEAIAEQRKMPEENLLLGRSGKDKTKEKKQKKAGKKVKEKPAENEKNKPSEVSSALPQAVVHDKDKARVDFEEPEAEVVSERPPQWYADNNVHRLDWPAQSPYLNHIEHLWGELDRRLRFREMRSTSIVQLSAMLQEEWRRIPVDILHKLVESMPDRVAAVIATRGGTTRF